MPHWQEHYGKPPGFETHRVIDAVSGRVVLDGATEHEFDRWYEHHAFWREPRAIEEVAPELRDAYRNRADRSDDGAQLHYLINV